MNSTSFGNGISHNIAEFLSFPILVRGMLSVVLLNRGENGLEGLILANTQCITLQNLTTSTKQTNAKRYEKPSFF